MEVKQKRKFPYTFKSKYKNHSVFLKCIGKMITFENFEFETEDEKIAEELKEIAKRGPYIKEVPVIELYRRANKKEEKDQPETIAEAVEKIEKTKKKKTFPCPECGKEFPHIEDLEKHKKKKHPEIYLITEIKRFREKRDRDFKKLVDKKLKSGSKSKKI